MHPWQLWRTRRGAGWLIALLLLVSGLIGRVATAYEGGADVPAPNRPAPLPRSDFISNCLLASGTLDGCELAHLRSQYGELQAQVAPQTLRQLPLVRRLQTLKDRLHVVILVGEYHKEASDLGLTLHRGDYNCLSATALYWDLAREAGHELEIWSLPGHVYLQVSGHEGTRIEPATKTSDATQRNLQSHSAHARRLTPEQLLGKFYYNRGVLALERGEHAVGVELLRQSLALDPLDAEARANLLAGLNNWAVKCCRQEQFAAAQALIQQGLAIDGRFAPLLANEQFVRDRRSLP